jgi:hypothetical protein
MEFVALKKGKSTRSREDVATMIIRRGLLDTILREVSKVVELKVFLLLKGACDSLTALDARLDEMVLVPAPAGAPRLDTSSTNWGHSLVSLHSASTTFYREDCWRRNSTTLLDEIRTIHQVCCIQKPLRENPPWAAISRPTRCLSLGLSGIAATGPPRRPRSDRSIMSTFRMRINDLKFCSPRLPIGD